MAQSAHKFSNDMRLLCHLREIEEPFEKNQIGSSAMAYKRNPMRSERIGSLSRFVISMTQNTSYTEATQWLERTLDDSANRRLSLPLAFMAVDAILILVSNVTDGLVVRDGVIRRRLEEHLPFIASEELLMKAVAAGGDRQALHEVIRTHAMAAADAMKEDGGSNDFLTRLDGDASFSLDSGAVDELMDPARFIGRAPSQVRRYVEEEVDTLLAQHPDDSVADTDLRV
jgi:adenylosuccinate lyase